jgi:hypothetical protein
MTYLQGVNAHKYAQRRRRFNAGGVPLGIKLSVVSGIDEWYRIPFDKSEMSISRIPPTDRVAIHE